MTSLSNPICPPFWVFTAHRHTHTGYDRIALTPGDTPSSSRAWWVIPPRSSVISHSWSECQWLGVVAWLQLLSFDFLFFSLSFCLDFSSPFLPLFIPLILSNCPQTATLFLFWTKKGSCEGYLVLWDSPPPCLPPPAFSFQPPALVNTFCHLHILWHRSFFFLRLKPCWLVTWTQTPSIVISLVLFSSGAPADGVCHFHDSLTSIL